LLRLNFYLTCTAAPEGFLFKVASFQLSTVS
jgi:hypothetical protein